MPDTPKLCRIGLDERPAILRRALPAGWQADQVTTRKLGDAWLAQGTHPVFAVPSALVPHATNYLIDRAHPDVAGAIEEQSVEEIWIDARFIR